MQTERLLMKRKFACIGFLYLSGMLAFSFGWGKYNYIIIALALSWTLIALLCKIKYRTYILAMAFAFYVGLSYSTVYTYSHYNRIMEYDGKEITLNGYVKDYMYTSSDVGFITVKGKINGDVNTQISFFVPHDEFEYYEEVQITGVVSRIEDSVDFQQEQYYRAKGIFLRGKTVDTVVRTGKNRNVLFKAIKEYRDYMYKLIVNTVDGQEGRFLAAMLCGDKSGLEQTTKTKLYRVGIGHIFSVSGTHLVIISSFFGLLFKYLRLNHKQRFLFMEIVVWSFVVFAGLSPSVLRSAVMITILCVSELFKRRADCLNTLGLCCVLLTLGNPYAVRDSSFLLSMTGVFALGVVLPKIIDYVKLKGLWGKVIKNTLTMFTLMFTVMSVTIWFFNEVSLVAPLANLILLPLCTLALSITVIVAVTGGVLFIAEPVLRLSGFMTKIVLALTDFMTSLKYCYITLSDKKLKIIAIIICICLLLFLFAIKSFRLRAISFVIATFALIIMFNINQIKEKDIIRILVIPDKNMNQTVVYKNSESVVLDNHAKGEHNKAIGRVVEKYGIREISAVVINDERYFSAGLYKSMYPVPERIISDFQDSECNDMYLNSKAFQFCGVDVTMKDDGYTIRIADEQIVIDKKGLYLQGIKYHINEIDFPVEIVYNKNSFEVRGLDYGFNEQ